MSVVLVTGGTGNLGRAVVDRLHAEGHTLVLAYRTKTPPVRERQIMIAADLEKSGAAAELVAHAIERAGRLDALVNLIGGYAGGTVVETDDALWHRMIALNLTSAFSLSRAVLPHLIALGGGRIVHVSSFAATAPFAGAAAYLTAKAGLITLVRAMAEEVAGAGVRVNAVLPTIIDTPENRKAMPDADPSKWVPPASVAKLIAFLVSDAASAINGAAIPVGVS